MPFMVKEDIVFDPINLILLGFNAVMFQPHDITDLSQQFLWPDGILHPIAFLFSQHLPLKIHMIFKTI